MEESSAASARFESQVSEGEAAGRSESDILILAPTRNDARLTFEFLKKAGLDAAICEGFGDLCQRVEAGCGALLLAEEVLTDHTIRHLILLLQKQPSWSDLPIVIITGTGESAIRRRQLAALEPTGNASIIERPVRPGTLVSTLESAMRSRRRQYQVRSLLEEREKMTADALQADRRKDEFLAMLAHELRNPLASVSNAATLLKTTSDLETQAWAAGVIERQTNQLAHLIDDLLDVSRITTGKIRLRHAITDMAMILDRACDSARPLMTERGHHFTCDFERGKLYLKADPTRIEQVVLNLLTNAAKYTPKGGRIQLLASRQGQDIVVTIKDNGMGIEPKRLPEMFQLFTQGERSIARSEGGLGIGLTIVQKLTEMHGGKVEAHSEGPGLGSSFTVYLPAAVAQVSSDQNIGAGPADKGKSLRVLVVDDNVDSAVGLSKLLKRVGHEVSVAYDGPEALEKARGQVPQAVVLDIGLPSMDGYEVARLLRQEFAESQPLLIAVTGYGQEEDRQRAMEAGFDHHLVKPVDVTKLKSLLSEQRERVGDAEVK
ncbi:phospho-acceptor domain-containing protein [Prosthecobacter fusiformis]|uniref:histidine kinase n=1 Tax=Prosthecobacter fusiformis TaxID=48464 RepID=A0A4R7SSW7_9BACT|nr:ATP-binding protein [Prosthecobacter fusiformis]TDU81327.1 phospho-acceptor domain-containing protein [Prosthecobacter fusiformis]